MYTYGVRRKQAEPEQVVIATEFEADEADDDADEDDAEHSDDE